jgi:hypothetical protein
MAPDGLPPSYDFVGDAYGPVPAPPGGSVPAAVAARKARSKCRHARSKKRKRCLKRARRGK